jgi:lipoprotein-releasing system ATP-binding protein
MNDVIVQCRGLQRSFETGTERLEILKSIDLEMNRGDKASITGPSGCGKSTLLSILGGLDHPSGGFITVGGYDISRADERSLASFRAKVIGFVFQFHYLLKDFTALENAMLPAFMAGKDRKTAEEKARLLLEAVGLGDRLDHIPAKLSGGERQRVAIARALVNDPELILADEPTGNLDEASSLVVEDLLFSMVDTCGSTLLLVTHDHRLARRGDRRFLLSEGRIREA